MRLRRSTLSMLLGLAFVGCASLAQADSAAVHPFVQVSLSSQADASGRLLLFVLDAKTAKAQARDGVVSEVDIDQLDPSKTWIAGRDVSHLSSAQPASIDGDGLSFPVPMSQLPPGDYYVQAVLDTNHSYNYTGRNAGDIVSDVVQVHLPLTKTPTLNLATTIPAMQPWTLPPSAKPAMRDGLPAAKEHAQLVDFVSPSLSAFWGRPIHMKAWVLTPPGYDAKSKQRYPVAYNTHGFGGGIDRFTPAMINTYAAMNNGQMPKMIWVFLDESSPTGTHEFADSVNNGPWGKALTEELIPHLESQYRMDANVRGRFLNGHSSGGWATLWLQTTYPKVFGGTWSTSPDPSDFHDFTGIDLYAPKANAYRKPDGSAIPLIRDKGKVLATFEQFSKVERVLGSYGGQITSFEYVFSPRGEDGRPMPMFNRDTGDVDSTVVAYWSEHYDIARRLQANWSKLKPDLDGKIHVYIGTADTFYLDGPAHRLKDVLDGLHAKAEVRFIPDRTHFDVSTIGDDRMGLTKEIAWQMYGIARPGEAQKPAAAAAP
ncbi:MULTISPECIES: alpha/beta hydrolase [Dyella]|uniref:Enterochelin esterase n=2 Tax=Dyella TaxID=231454 RepID=A0A4R0Z0K2_9GAMM|nr:MULTISPECIES: alpha/beta hydrolase-fold protein [Dyella]TBR39764.1 enterochelin esterase [Dyella terrae]TCI12656.1 enterochelin esterase [Dyella soli]